MRVEPFWLQTTKIMIYLVFFFKQNSNWIIEIEYLIYIIHVDYFLIHIVLQT